jgi:hypothetical protein
MNIEELTLKQIRELQTMFSVTPAVQHRFVIGKNYIIRTVTMIYTGKLISVDATELVMVECSWIPDTGRYMQFVAEGKVNECEPYPAEKEVIIGRGGLMDAVILDAALPRSQK